MLIGICRAASVDVLKQMAALMNCKPWSRVKTSLDYEKPTGELTETKNAAKKEAAVKNVPGDVLP